MTEEGVKLTELHCPTCRAQFQPPFVIYPDYGDDAIFQSLTSITYLGYIEGPRAMYLVCPNRHRWSVTTIWRTEDPYVPDKVQLGQYLGVD